MEAADTDFVKLQKLSEEKEAVDCKIEEKLERYLELQELVEKIRNGEA